MNIHSVAYQTILAGVALQAKGHPAILRAVDIARRTKGRVSLVHATTAENNAIVEETEYRLREMQARYPEISGFDLIRGRTWEAINEVAAVKKADLIVIGSHVHSQLLALLGAISDRVLHHAQRDVLVVRSDLYDETHPPAGYTRILAGTDLREHSQAACARAAMLARAYQATLGLVHVIGHYPVDRENDDITPENQDPVSYQKRIQGERLKQIAEAIGWPDADCEVIVTGDSAHSAVSDYAKAQAADLLVLGSQEHAGVNKLLGSTADGIIHHAPCDVLVARA
jgi:universal stress protein A